MKISALEEYALRCLLQLAKSYDKGIPLSSEEISSKELISPAYTEKILQKLSKSGFVKSIRGTKGGYILTESPDKIFVGHVIKDIDGFFISDICNNFSGTSDECTNLFNCGIRPIWMNIYKYIYQVLDNTSLYDLLKDEENISKKIEEQFKEVLKV
jgi:Rrf2 family protein